MDKEKLKLSESQEEAVRAGHPLMVVLIIAIAYFGLAILTIKLVAILPSNAAPVWASAGIALFAVLCYGRDGFIGVLLGAFALYLFTGQTDGNSAFHPYLYALLKAFANALQSLLGAYLIRRFAGFPDFMSNEASIIKFVLLAAPVSCVISATCNIGIELYYGNILPEEYFSNWIVWWVGDSIGVLIFTPLLLAYVHRVDELWRYRHISFTAPLIIVFLSYFSIQAQNSKNEIEKQKLLFDQSVNEMAAVIDQRFQSQLELISMVKLLFSSSDYVSRTDFKTFTEALIKNNPDILALEWIQRVPDNQREQFVQRIIDEGFEFFQIKDQQNDELLPAAEAEEYLVINYLEPFEKNAVAHGYNILSKPEARQAVLRARELDKPIATRPIRLIQETRDQIGFVVYNPVNEIIPAARSVTGQQESVFGLVAAVFRIEQLMNIPKSMVKNEGLFFEIFDVTADANKQRIYSMQQNANVLLDSNLTQHVSISFANRDWDIYFYPTSQFIEKNLGANQTALLLADLMIAIFLVGWLLSITGRHYRTEQIVSLRTDDLRREIEERSRAEKMLSYHASHDMLTDLYNRREFEQRLLTLSNQGGDSTNVLCFMDLDHFKIVNDTCGHVAGDEMLRQISVQLLDSVRSSDLLSRFGGDEFALLLENCEIEKALSICEEILQKINDYKFNWDDKVFNPGISIGVVAIDKYGKDLNELIKEADEACYKAKLQGRNRICLYSEDKSVTKHKGEVEWVTRINWAIEDNRFTMMAQEIRHTGSGEPMYELLIRMIDSNGKMLSPAEFLPVAERYNLVEKIDYWVINHVCEKITSLADMSTMPILCINLSGVSIMRSEFLDFVMEKLTAIPIACDRICFEITETSAISSLVEAELFIKKLKELGCAFALDDFGSGFSSFAYLKNLPVDFLKIDGVFVKDIIDDEVDRSMVHSINDIGHVMGKKTIAEFVETEMILENLREIGVDYVQGYGVAMPVPFEDIFNK